MCYAIRCRDCSYPISSPATTRSAAYLVHVAIRTEPGRQLVGAALRSTSKLVALELSLGRM